MILDNALLFTGTSNGATAGITASANTDSLAQAAGTYTLSNVIDIGLNGLPTSAGGGGARDLGIGDDPALKLLILVTTTATSGGAATVQFELDGAPDNGSGVAGAYSVMWQSQAIGYATLLQGTYVANIDLPRPPPGVNIPRFYRVRFIVATATVTAGAVEAAIVIDRFDNITSSVGALSGYPSGVTVAN
jgi:hypothetical protein